MGIDLTSAAPLAPAALYAALVQFRKWNSLFAARCLHQARNWRCSGAKVVTKDSHFAES